MKKCLVTTTLPLNADQSFENFWYQLSDELGEKNIELTLLSPTLPQMGSRLIEKFKIIQIPFGLKNHIEFFPVPTDKDYLEALVHFMNYEKLPKIERHITGDEALEDHYNGIYNTYMYYKSLLLEIKPDIVLAWTDNLPQSLILRDLADMNDIPNFSLERGLFPKTMELIFVDLHSDKIASNMYHLSNNQKLDKAYFSEIKEFYTKNRIENYRQLDFEKTTKLIEQLAGKKKIILSFWGQRCNDEAEIEKHLNEFYQHNHESYQVIIKPHPADADKYPNNDIVIDKNANVYALMEKSDIFMVTGTSLQYQMLLTDKPIIFLGNRTSTYFDLGSYGSSSWDYAEFEDVILNAKNQSEQQIENRKKHIQWHMKYRLYGIDDAPTKLGIRDMVTLIDNASSHGKFLRGREQKERYPSKTINDVDPDYKEKVDQEIAIYEHNTEVHNLPSIHNIYTREFLVPNLKDLTGCSDWMEWWIQDIDSLVEKTGRKLRLLSLACGNGDTEIGMVKRLKHSDKVELVGVDINPSMIARGREAAVAEGLSNVLFEVQDLNNPNLTGPFDVIMANHSLHHLIELEKLFKHLAEKSSKDMIFLINDMIGRNGHVMWPNANIVVNEIWRRLDQRYKLNAYNKRYDAQPFNRDCSLNGFEGIRAQDIIPALIKEFDVEMYFPFATLINRFVDRGYGPNFNVEDEADKRLILDILALDVKLLEEKKLSPTQAFIKLQKKGTVKEPRILFQTPEESISSRQFKLSLTDYYSDIQEFLPLLANPGADAQMAEHENIPLVSVIIPVFNNLQYTHNCIKSIFQNTHYSRYEVIIVDNASTDGTGQYLSNLGHQNLKILSNTENLGFVGGCNAGAAEAKGDFIFFLNNDTEVRPFWLSAVVDLMQARPDCGAVGSKLIYPDGELQEAGGIIFSDGDGWNVGRGMNPKDPRFNYVREVDYCSGAALTIRTELWEKIGGFDQLYSPAYYEDTDLCFSVRQQGYKVLYQPLSSVTHYEGKTAGTDLNSGFKKYQAINRVKFTKKWEHELSQQYEHDPANVIKAAERGGKENILIADPQLPMWDKASGSLRLFQTVEILAAANFHVVFIARASSPAQVNYVAKLISLGVEVYPQDAAALKKTVINYSLDKMVPIDYGILFKEKRFKYAILSFWEIGAHYISIIRKLSPQTKIIVDTVDVHFVRELRESELTKDKKQRKLALTRKKLEIKTYKEADELWVVTAEDQIELENVKLTQPIHILPNIHKSIEYRKEYDKSHDLLFVGNFNHTPNRDAILYFCDSVFPLIKKQLPNVKFYIVGNKPPQNIVHLAQDDIIVTGFVEDISPYLFHARVSVNPLRYGAGMKGKVGEALSWGLPVVTSSIGAEGMHLEHNRHCLVADEPETFAAEVVRVYRDPALWQTLSEQGRDLVEQNWSPSATKRILRTVLDLKDPSDVPQVSIIILTWNALDYTRKCIQSIAEHTSYPYEIIFVDNASSDGTQAFLKQLVKDNSNYTLIENSVNKGFAAGNNQGVAAASGKHVLLLNNDVLVADGWLEKLLEGLELDEKIGMIGPITNHISGRQMITEIPYEDDQGYYEFAGKVAAQNQNKVTPRRRIAGFAVLMTRQLYQAVGGLDEGFGTGNFEDDDLCLKVQAEGYAIMVHEGVFIHHYGSQTFKANKMDYAASLDSKGQVFRQKWPEIDYDELLEIKHPLSETHPKLYSSAMGQLEKGEFEGAYKILEQLLCENPVDENALVGLIMSARASGKTEVALANIRRLIHLNPNNAVAYNISGLLASEAGSLDSAKKLFKTAIEKDKDFLDARRNYAEILLMGDEFQEGVQHLMEILTQYPEDVMTLLRLAELNIEAGRMEEAVALARKVLEVDPAQPMAAQIIQSMEN